MKICLVVSFRFPLLHAWPECRVPGKDYLRHPHRHLLHGRAWLSASHPERETEFIDAKEKIEAWCRERFSGPVVGLSCENVAREILEAFSCQGVEILEDGENGALVLKEPA
jgi:hypothetical protein